MKFSRKKFSIFLIFIQKKTGNYNVSIAFPSSHVALISTGSGALYLVNIMEFEGKERWQLHQPDGLPVFDEKKACTLANAYLQTVKEGHLLHVITLQIEEKNSQSTNVKECGLFETILKWRIFIEADDKSWKEKSLNVFSVDGNVDYVSFEKNCKSLYIVCDKEPKCIEDDGNIIFTDKDDCNETIKCDLENNYFWTQTEKEITIWFPVAETVTKKDIEISLNDLTINIKIKNEPVLCREFFQRIDSGLSVWCFEKNRLEVQLVKNESGLMWRTLFSKGDEGKEIIDPDLVCAIHEKLAHLCSENNDNLPPFNTQELEECDVPNCSSSSLIRFDALHQKVTHKVNLSNSQWLFSVCLDPYQPPAICCRHDVDACVWQLSEYDEGKNTWPCKHVGTFNAFGYVQAGKTQKKFMVCAPNLSYVAVCEASHHIYIYRQPSPLFSELKNRNTGKKVRTIAKQQLINLETNEQILGVYATDHHLHTLLQNSICVSVIND